MIPATRGCHGCRGCRGLFPACTAADTSTCSDMQSAPARHTPNPDSAVRLCVSMHAGEAGWNSRTRLLVYVAAARMSRQSRGWKERMRESAAADTCTHPFTPTPLLSESTTGPQGRIRPGLRPFRENPNRSMSFHLEEGGGTHCCSWERRMEASCDRRMAS